MSFIRFGRISCFPEFSKKMSDCEYTRISFRNVNDESLLSLGYQSEFKICFHDLYSLLHSILFSIHWCENSMFCC